MSYCRWSSDDFSSDLYCYADTGGGWSTHVACLRHVGEIPKVDWTLLRQGEAGRKKWMDQYCEQMGWLEKCERKPIGLPHDGETFNDPTLEAFKERLLSLRALGYRFPDYVLEEIEEEMTEERLNAGGISPPTA